MQPQTSNRISSLPIKAGLFLALLSVFVIPAHFTHALTVSPARVEVSADPGQTINGQFHVINEQGGAQIFYSSTENFEAQGETGTPSFVPGTTGLASWISLGSQISLKAGEEKVIPFTVSVPKNADAGGYFAAIFLSTTPIKDSTISVSVGAKIGVLVLLHVNGVVKQSGGLLEFSTDNSQRFFSSLPVSFMYRFNNTGADRVQPTGTITVKNNLMMTSATLSANLSQGNILPDSIRRFEVVWNTDQSNAPTSGFWAKTSYEMSHFALGFYTAHLALAYGTQTSPESTFTFFILPWHLLLVVLIILIVLGLVLTKGLKSYNSYIIKSAQRS